VLIVSHYTPAYRDHARRLLRSAYKFSYVPYAVRPTTDLGSWAANCRVRAALLLGVFAVNPYPTEPILWVDADAEFMDKPRRHFEPPVACDIGVHFHHLDRKPSPGTLYLEQTDATWRFLVAWNEEIVRLGTEDKAAFPAAIERVPGLRVWRLPESLCFIRDLAKDPDGPVVIEHHQASRQMRRRC